MVKAWNTDSLDGKKPFNKQLDVTNTSQGVAGAGKTTLLDVLADRVTTGTATDDISMDGKGRGASFRRRVGYVQQEDIHLPATTVREALEFSALLRQPNKVSTRRKKEYVNEVLRMMDMEQYADAVIGVPGEGRNVEQRRRFAIAVELATKPDLLLFLGISPCHDFLSFLSFFCLELI